MFKKVLMIWGLYSILAAVLLTEGSEEVFLNSTLSYDPQSDRDSLVSLINRCYEEGSFEAINDTTCNGLFFSYLCSKHTDRQCETFVIGVDPTGTPTKCNDYYYGLHPSVTNHKPNYCMDEAQEVGRHPVKTLAHILGYSVSVVCLLIALSFFCCIRTLQSPLGRILKQVYIAVLVNNTLWIVWHVALHYDMKIITGDKLICKVFHIAVNYFLATSYFWLLALCLHLQQLVKTLVIEDMWSFGCYGLLGWGGPLVVVSAYTASRYYFEYTDGCWLVQVNSSLILALSNTIVLLYSFVLVLWMLGRTIHDIHRSVSDTTKLAKLKAAHAALFEVLLLGILLLLMPLRPNSEMNEENIIWDVVWIFLQNSQGMWFAAFLSSSNVEVRAMIKRYLPGFGPKPDNNMEMGEASGSQSNQSTLSSRTRATRRQLNT